jgi:hypothetical protein
MLRQLAILLLAAAPAWTNDTFVHESSGNLMFVNNNQVAIQRERLTIGPPRSQAKLDEWQIPFHIEYDLENVSGAQVQARIGFPLPACSLNDYILAKLQDFVTGGADTCVKQTPMTLEVAGKAVLGDGITYFFATAPRSMLRCET